LESKEAMPTLQQKDDKWKKKKILLMKQWRQDERGVFFFVSL